MLCECQEVRWLVRSRSISVGGFLSSLRSLESSLFLSLLASFMLPARNVDTAGKVRLHYNCCFILTYYVTPAPCNWEDGMCHPVGAPSRVSVWFFWCWLTQVLPDKRVLNVCCCVVVILLLQLHYGQLTTTMVMWVFLSLNNYYNHFTAPPLDFVWDYPGEPLPER